MSINVGHCIITAAELWVMFWGLLVSCSLGLCKILLKTDSRATMELVEQDLEATHAHAVLITRIRNLLLEDQFVEIKHMYQEANSCVDKLTKFGHKCPMVSPFLITFQHVSCSSSYRIKSVIVLLEQFINNSWAQALLLIIIIKKDLKLVPHV